MHEFENIWTEGRGCETIISLRTVKKIVVEQRSIALSIFLQEWLT